MAGAICPRSSRPFRAPTASPNAELPLQANKPCRVIFQSGGELRSASAPPGAEDRGADPHMGRAEADRGLEIGAHAHAEHGERRCAGRSRAAARNAATAPRRAAGCTSARRSAGRAARGNRAMKASAAAGNTPAFCGSSPVLTSMRQGRRRPVRSISRASASARRGRSTVSMTSKCATASLHLVGLQRADQVQREVGKFAPQRGKFRQRLLHPVLAEDALAGGERRAHRVGRVGLADRDQRRPRRPAGRRRARPRRSGRARRRDWRRSKRLFHNGSIPGTKLHRVPRPVRGAAPQDACDVRLVITACCSRLPQAFRCCSPDAPPTRTDANPTRRGRSCRQPAQQQASRRTPTGEMDTEATIWTRARHRQEAASRISGPQTGRGGQPGPVAGGARHAELRRDRLGRPDDRAGW